MPIDHDMPSAWKAQAARNCSPEVAATIAARSQQVREAAFETPLAGEPPEDAAAGLDELSRRRVARFAALEARRLTTRPPGPPSPPLPPVAS